jgi:RNA polymerase sigma-70 factor, ECF subfamily
MVTTGPARATANELELLEAAQRADGDAYGRLVGPYRSELHAHCYRMLGSAADAEDALQETLLRAWRGLPKFEARSSVRFWLHTIATNVCLRAAERRPKRVLPVDYGPAADPHDGLAGPVTEAVWLEPYPDDRIALASGLAGPDARYEQRESVELAFIAALQYLPARQRAVLILRDVLGFSARETAAALETTPISVDSALQRAHKTVDQRLPERSQQATLRSLGDHALSEVVRRYVAAWERNDVDAVVAMLAEDAKMTMPPIPTWYQDANRSECSLVAWCWQLRNAGASSRLARTGSLHSAPTSGTRRRRPSWRTPSWSSDCAVRRSRRSQPSALRMPCVASAFPAPSLHTGRASAPRCSLGTADPNDNGCGSDGAT